MLQQEFGHLAALTAPYGAMLPLHTLQTKFMLTMMFLSVRTNCLPKLHDVTISTTSEAGGIVCDKNGGRK
jgi:hypothetical protein